MVHEMSVHVLSVCE